MGRRSRRTPCRRGGGRLRGPRREASHPHRIASCGAAAPDSLLPTTTGDCEVVTKPKDAVVPETRRVTSISVHSPFVIGPETTPPEASLGAFAYLTRRSLHCPPDARRTMRPVVEFA